MRRKGIIGALLLVGVGVVLGTTVFRADIAQATGLAQGVTVTNTPAQAVPVREQNLDGGNIKVHEQGTANVAGTVGLSSAANTVKIAPTPSNTSYAVSCLCFGALALGKTIDASLVAVSLDDGTNSVTFKNGSESVLTLFGPREHGQPQWVLPLLQSVRIDGYDINCNTISGNCNVDISIVGTQVP